MNYVRHTLIAGLLVLLFTAGGAWGQEAPLVARSSAPIVQPGDTSTVTLRIGSDSAPAHNLFGVGFQLAFDADDFAFVGFERGTLFASELANATALEFVRGAGDSDGDGIPDATEDGSVAYSVTLTGGQGKTADGLKAIGRFMFVARDTAETGTFHFALQDATRSTPKNPNVEITDLQDASVEVSTTERARRRQVGAGDPPLIRFPRLGSLTIDFSSLDDVANLTITRSAVAPGGTDLPNGDDDYRFATTGFWQLAQRGATDFTAEVCMPFALLTDRLIDNEALRLVKRPDKTEPWTILTTTLKPNANAPQRACATVESFSDLTAAAPLSALPVELASFEASAMGDDAVALAWRTVSETNNHGFSVLRATTRQGGWTEIGFRRGAGTTTEAQSYHFTDDDLPFEAERVHYRLKQIDLDGTTTYSQGVEVAVAQPEQFAAYGAFPNPVGLATTIRYELPEQRHVVLEVYDVLGRKVATLVDARQEAGRKQIRFDASRLPTGVYVYRLQAGDDVETRRVVVVR